MIEASKFLSILRANSINFFSGVPDSLLNDFCLHLSDNLALSDHVIAANEGNAIGIATGQYLATGEVPLVYMQNSGLGNAMNPLISLTNKETYSIPMVLLIGWRGAPGEIDWAHHQKQGIESPTILDSLDIPFRVLSTETENEVEEIIKWAKDKALLLSSPVAILVGKSVLSKPDKKDLLQEQSKLKLTREDVIDILINHLPSNTIFIATTGRATREIYAVRERYDSKHSCDFLNVGSMGHASSIAFGIAKNKIDRLVVCLDGDAANLMHMGSMAIIGSSGVNNILHVVLNNGAHESVGGQPSVSQKINLTNVAKSLGYSTLNKALVEKEDLISSLEIVLSSKKPVFIDVHIRKGIRKEIPGLKVSLQQLKNDLMNNLKEN